MSLGFGLPVTLASQSNNFVIPADVNVIGGGEKAKSNNYVLDDTIGEANIGDSKTANFTLNAGYRQAADADSYLSLGCSATAVLPSVVANGQSTGSGTCVVTTDAIAGYNLSWAILTGSGGTNTGSLNNQYGDAITPFDRSTTGLVAYWKMEENAAGATVKDYSGNGNNGTPNIAGSPPQPSTETPLNMNTSDVHSLVFDGASTHVSTPVTVGKAFTWSVWFKSPTANSPCSNAQFMSLITIQSPNYLLMDICENAASFWSPDGLAGATLSIAGLANNTWYHLVFVREGDSIVNGYKTYLNGIIQGQATSGVWSSTDVIWLGDRNGYTQPLNGSLDEVRIYNRAISAAEVQSLANTPHSWSVSSTNRGWGARLRSSSTDTDAKWGTDNSTDKWLNIGDGNYRVVSRPSASLTGSAEIFQYRAEIGSSIFQPTGLYQATVTYTAVSL